MNYSTHKIKTINGIRYENSYEDYAAIFPIFENLPLKSAFSWGKKAPNMSTDLGSIDQGLGETVEKNQKNVEKFLEDLGFASYPNVVQTFGKFTEDLWQIEEVSKDSKEKVVAANFIFTRDPKITLIIKPGDCPVCVLYGKDGNGNGFVAIDHSGANAVNAGMSKQGALYLKDELGVDLSKVIVGVAPGISKEKYFITNEPGRRPNGIIEDNWKEFITSKKTNDLSEKRYVDTQMASILQLIEAGVNPDNIEAYTPDTYESARNGESFSNRFTKENGGKRTGRFIVAAQVLTV